PAALRARLTERDGRLGTLVAVTPGATFDEWNGHDLLRFAAAIRELPLPGGGTVTTSGPSVIFADILTAIRRDGAIVTAWASVALGAMVLLLVGRNRRALAVLAATALGSLAMIAICALVGLRINFLDFVALPIALGLGIDYAINMADRADGADRADRRDPRLALRSTGGSVLVCSLTTMIGYASLLVSSNLAIRGFGLASLIGEVTCAATALALVPAICALRRVAASPAGAAEKVVGLPQRT
ncbi:MAG TPA: MMPL family transporter, partial [Kofleriaceae bacterium]